MEAVARQGRRLRFLHLEARCVAAEAGMSRVGFVVPKHGQTAVRRNLLKRRLREWVRLELLPRLGSSGVQPIDMVIRARHPAYQASQAALRQEFDRLVTAVMRFAGTRS